MTVLELSRADVTFLIRTHKLLHNGITLSVDGRRFLIERLLSTGPITGYTYEVQPQ